MSTACSKKCAKDLSQENEETKEVVKICQENEILRLIEVKTKDLSSIGGFIKEKIPYSLHNTQ